MISHSSIQAHGKSIQGAGRKKNDDRFLITPITEEYLLIAVSDGMGGHPNGDKAAEIIIERLQALDIRQEDKALLLHNALHMADSVITAEVATNPDSAGMGATATSALLSKNMVHWAHIGDSRMYLARQGSLRQVTRDHTFVQGQIDAGHISRQEAINHPFAHVLEQCIGCIDTNIEHGSFAVLPGDSILVCSDGLFRNLAEDQLLDILASGQPPVEQVERLFDSSEEKVAIDDATAIVASIP
ncbi:MAG: PP2C family serine/threonine-protein phosphatase [Desulfopila sp.]